MSDSTIESRTPLNPRFADFLSAPVPRTIPEEYRKAAYKQSGGWAGIVVPIVMIVVVLCMAVGTCPPAAVINDLRFDKKAVALNKTGTITGVSRIHGKHGYVTSKYEFAYAIDGRTFSGTCYRHESDWDVGQKVPLEALPGDPSLARPIGSAFCQQGIGMLLYMGLFFPGILVIGLVSARTGYKRSLALLERGEVAEMRVSEAWTPFFKGRGTAGKMTIEYPGFSGTIAVNSKPILEKAKTAAASGAAVFIVCDAADPKKRFFAEWLLNELG